MYPPSAILLLISEVSAGKRLTWFFSTINSAGPKSIKETSCHERRASLHWVRRATRFSTVRSSENVVVMSFKFQASSLEKTTLVYHIFYKCCVEYWTENSFDIYRNIGTFFIYINSADLYLTHVHDRRQNYGIWHYHLS